MTPLIKQILEVALEGEMAAHLSDCQAQGLANRRNSKTSKTVKTGTGAFELETPRDREGSFEPEIGKRRQTVLNESLDNKIVSLYTIGMSYESIAEHLEELYDSNVSTAKISQITDKLLPVITEWLLDPQIASFRDVFMTYELLAYLSYRVPKLGYVCKELPTVRRYPTGEVPTKISGFKSNFIVLNTLFRACAGKYNVA